MADPGPEPDGLAHSLSEFPVLAPPSDEPDAEARRQLAEAETERGSPPVQKQKNRTGLPDRLKAGVEGLSGLSMDGVRVHYGSPEPSRLQALAYARGTQIYLGPGQERHLPHEAWHVVQQMQGRVQPTLRTGGAAINEDEDLEREADRLGELAQRGAVGQTTMSSEQAGHGEESRDSPREVIGSSYSTVQRVENKLGFEIEFRKNPVFKSAGFSKNRALNFLSGAIDAAPVRQRPRIVMQPDTARVAGASWALSRIPKPWRHPVSFAELEGAVVMAHAPEVKTDEEYARSEEQLLRDDLRWLGGEWYARFGQPLPGAQTDPQVGGMQIGVPVDELARWAIRQPEAGEEEAHQAVAAKFKQELVTGWAHYNDPALHLQVTVGVDLQDVGEFFEAQATVVEGRVETAGLAQADEEELLRAADILRRANAMANAIEDDYLRAYRFVEKRVHGAWALVFQDLLRLVLGRKRVGSSAKNIFVFLPRSTKVTLETISESIRDKELFEQLMGHAKRMLLDVLEGAGDGAPDPETVKFLASIGASIDVEYEQPVRTAPEGAEEVARYRFTTLIDAMVAFYASAKTQHTELPWSTAGTREIESPRPQAVLLEDRHINKFVRDWATLEALVLESLLGVR